MINYFLRSSWECDSPSQAKKAVSYAGLIQGLEWSNGCIDGSTASLTMLTMAGGY